MLKIHRIFKFVLLIFMTLSIKANLHAASDWSQFVNQYKNGGGVISISGNTDSNVWRPTSRVALNTSNANVIGIKGDDMAPQVNARDMVAGMSIINKDFSFKNLHLSNFSKSANTLSLITPINSNPIVRYSGGAIFISNNDSMSKTIAFEPILDWIFGQLNNQFSQNTLSFANTSNILAGGGAIFATVAIRDAADTGTDLILAFSKVSGNERDKSHVGFANNSAVSNANSQSAGGALFAAGNVNADALFTQTIVVNFSSITANGEYSAAGYAENLGKIDGNFAETKGQNSQSLGGAFFFAASVANSSSSINGAARINFYKSAALFELNSARVLGRGSQAQGGALFVSGFAGNLALGIAQEGVNTKLLFLDSAIVFSKNYLQTSADYVQMQGAGAFFSGISNLRSFANPEISGLVLADFEGSQASFLQNNALVYSYSQVQGGGLFIAGTAISSSSLFDSAPLDANTVVNFAKLNFKNSLLDISQNQIKIGGINSIAHGGGLFAAAVSAFNRARINETAISSAVLAADNSIFTFKDNFIDIYGANAQGLGGAMFLAGITASQEARAFGESPEELYKKLIVEFNSSDISLSGNIIRLQGGAGYGQAAGAGLAIAGSVAGGVKGLAHAAISSVSFVNNSIVVIEGNKIEQDSAYSQKLGVGLALIGSIAGGAADNAGNGKVYFNALDSVISLLNNGDAVSSPNWAQNLGGGLFAAGAVVGGNGAKATAGLVKFDSIRSTLTISGNKAQLGGGIFIAASVAGGANSSNGGGNAVVLNFTDSKLIIENNEAYLGGGLYAARAISNGASALYLEDQASSVNIEFNNSHVIFSGNRSQSGRGAAIYAEGGVNIKFTGGKLEFIGNGVLSQNTKGIIEKDDISVIDFYSDPNLKVSAHGNKAWLGGFLYVDRDLFFGSSVSASSNTAKRGGAFYVSNAELSFNNEVSIVGNLAETGAAIFLTGVSTLNFNGDVFIGYNTAAQGGIIQWDPNFSMDMNLSGNMTAQGNSAREYGGFFHLMGQRTSINLHSANQTILFKDNAAAGYGGVIFAVNKSTIFITNVSGNEENQIIFESNKDLNFRNGSRANDLYILDSALVISGFADDKVSFKGGIYAKNSVLDWSNSESISLGGLNYFENVTLVTGGNNLHIGYDEYLTTISWTRSSAFDLRQIRAFTLKNTRFEFSRNIKNGALIIKEGGYGIAFSSESTLLFINNFNLNSQTAQKGGIFIATLQGAAIDVDMKSNIIAKHNYADTGFLSLFNPQTSANNITIKIGFNDGIFSNESEFTRNIGINNGGALSVVNQNAVQKTELTLRGQTIRFDSNMAGSRGGAIYAQGLGAAIVFENVEKVSFNGNRQNPRGLSDFRAVLNDIFLTSGAALRFLNVGSVEINGGLYAQDFALIEIEADNVLFAGGFNYTSQTTFTIKKGDILFDRTELIYKESQGFNLPDNSRTGIVNFTFKDSTARFIQNKQTIFGAGSGSNLLDRSSLPAEAGAVFERSHIFFEDNSINREGDNLIANGAILSNHFLKQVSFSNSNIYFRNNSASARSASPLNPSMAFGGAISLYNDSEVSFKDSNVVFEGNNVSGQEGGISGQQAFKSGGGAIYARAYYYDALNAYIPNLIFERTNVTFKDNQTNGRGGALFIENIETEKIDDVSQRPWVAFKNLNVSFAQNKADQGGAIAAGSQGRMKFENVSASFKSNEASKGGAIAVISENVLADNSSYTTEILFENSNASFNANKGLDSGGAAYIAAYLESSESVGGKYAARLIFDANAVSWSGNEAQLYGGAVYILGNDSSDAELIFRNGNRSYFSNNRASLGGAILLDTRAGLIFDNVNSVFEDNIASSSGGAIYAMYKQRGSGGEEQTVIQSSNSNLIFKGNRAYAGAAIYLKGERRDREQYAQLFLDGGETQFINNVSFGEGAKGVLSFDEYSTLYVLNQARITAIGNYAEKGGFLYLSGESIDAGGLLFDGDINISANSAKKGAALYLINGVKLKFTGNVSINNNITIADNSWDGSEQGGGAIYIDNTYPGNSVILDFSQVKTLSAIGNVSGFHGGFLFLPESSHPALFGANTEISGNQTRNAGAGGAIYMAQDAKIDLKTDNLAKDGGRIYFRNNVALSSGGAIYMGAGSVSSMTAQYGDIIFHDNKAFVGTARALSNDIFADEGSKIAFRAIDGASIYLYSGLIGAKTNIIEVFEGSGKTVLAGNTSAGILQIRSGGRIYASAYSGYGITDNPNPSSAMSIDTIRADEGSILAVGAPSSSRNIRLITYDAQIDGALEVVVNAANRTYGQVVVSSYIAVSTHSALRFNVNGNGLISGNAIVNINGSAKNGIWYSGGFASIDEYSIDAYTKLLSVQKDPVNNSYTGEFILIRHKDFSDLSNISRNQREIGHSISGSNWKYNSEPQDLVISIRDAIGRKGADYGKEVLDSLSGVFFANSLKLASVNNRPAMFYSKLDAFIAQEQDSSKKTEMIYDSLWAEPIIKGIEYGRNNDNPRTFKSFGYGLQVGSNFINESGYMAGFSMGINLNKMEQGLDKADMTEINVGMFGARYGLNSNVKGNLTISQHTFSSKRTIDIEGDSTHYKQTANADFQAYALSFGAEYEYIIIAVNETDIKPFVGIQNTMVFNDEIKETGGGAVGLMVEEDSYLRSDLTGGIKLQNSSEKFRWYGKIYMGYILAGASRQYEISFLSDELNKTRRDIRSYDEKRLFTGLGAGAAYKVKDDISVYINTDLAAAQEHRAYYLGIGVNFRLDKGFAVRPR